MAHRVRASPKQPIFHESTDLPIPHRPSTFYDQNASSKEQSGTGVSFHDFSECAATQAQPPCVIAGYGA
ncbi:hypothetical protein HK097_009866 [Rhizophlyctis rosea]|uniref:Uncharacterized protein n=1 Tax=Rhizophlyctis rosea TaxID=64517 RepID=A0AAD5X3H7_9FUNG|nr:hypothetical protein HK097_009866 [Rhizophlyctis rosea]